MEAPAVGYRTTAASNLRKVAILGAIGVGLSGTYALTGIGMPCPWRWATGTLCPFCGSTRLGVHLLGGDLVGAWQSNQFVFVMLLGLVVAAATWVVAALGGPAIRLPKALRNQGAWYLVLGVSALLFWFLRNL